MAFRKKTESEKAVQLCKCKCIVCGWGGLSLSGTPLVVGAHVKPIANMEEDSFDDIIALCPNHHAEFDAFKFFIDPDTRQIIYTDGSQNIHPPIGDIKYIRKEYLAYRQYITEKELDHLNSLRGTVRYRQELCAN